MTLDQRGRLVLFGAVAALLAVAAPMVSSAAPKADRGTSGDDRVTLTGRADTFRALAGDDRVRGEGGRDRLFGGPGADRLTGGAGRDRLAGGPGSDRLDARDGRADTRISGGPGNDVCLIDEADRPRVRGCEKVRPAPRPPISPEPVPEPDPDPDQIEEPGPADPDPVDPTDPEPGLSDAFVNRNWSPTLYDSCPKALHESYSVVGPDGKLYPTWHPPNVVNPATGEMCSFGHEHGADPAGSDLFEWVASRTAAPGFEDRAGIPFGYANEELTEYSAANPTYATRFEDHVGHKIDYANDVDLLDEDGRYVKTPGPAGAEVRVSCDYLFKVHQGSHSPDAVTNNVHELLFAARCNDGTEMITTTMARFGAGGQFNRSCAPGTTVTAAASSPYPSGGGQRLLPDRGCVQDYVLVPPNAPSRQSDIWALYENWQLESELKTADGRLLASFDPWFAVRNPSRYSYPAAGTPTSVGRTVDAAWETDPTDNGVVNALPWTDVADLDPFDYRDPRSPFDGSQRDFYVHDAEVRNAGGAERWYTDPYGENASTTPFPGAICQIISTTDNSADPELKRRLFGRDDDYGSANGVHAPN